MNNLFIVCSSTMLIILFSFPVTPQAKEQTIDLTVCVAGTCDVLSEAQDWETESCEARGIGWSNKDFNPLETFTVFIKSLLAIQEGKWHMNTLIKYLDSQGDYIVFRNNKVFGGTGKWEGVTGEIQRKFIRMGKSMPTNNFANCHNVTGTFEMPE